MTRRVRTTRQLAVVMNLDVDKALALLIDEERRGHMERCEGGWRLTEAGERRYGQDFRDTEMGSPR